MKFQPKELNLYYDNNIKTIFDEKKDFLEKRKITILEDASYIAFAGSHKVAGLFNFNVYEIAASAFHYFFICQNHYLIVSTQEKLRRETFLYIAVLLEFTFIQKKNSDQLDDDIKKAFGCFNLNFENV